MRRVLPLALLLALFVSLTAAQNDVVSLSGVFTDVSAASDYTELTFQLPEMTVEEIELDGVAYKQIMHPLAGSTRELGYPELPTFSTMLAVPAGAHVSIELVDSQTQDLGVMRVAPAQELDESLNAPVFVERDVYEGRKSYKTDAVRVGEVATMRDFHVVAFTVSPYEWDSATGELTVRTQMTVRVHHDGQVTPPARMSRSFVPMYKGAIANYDTIMRDVEPEYQPRTILLVHNGNAGLAPYVQQFVEWKRDKGFIVTEYTNITNSGAIRNYIQTAYNTWDNPPEYIIILGDVSGTYNIPTFYESYYGGEGDHMYACLDGDDLLPEAFVGRISISSQNEFITWLSKMDLWERDTYMVEPEFYHHSTLVGDTNPSGLSCVITNKYIKELIAGHDPSHTFTELYGSNPNSSEMDNGINQGSLFFNYRGWIGMSGWGNTNISGLQNYSQVCNATILTCDTGSFAEGTSRTEAFIRAGSPSQPTGAVSAVGMSTSHTHTRFNNILQGGMYHGLFVEGMDCMGEAVMRGKLALYLAYNGSEPDAVFEFTYWCNLIGDPTLQIWRTEPIIMEAEYESTLPLGTDWIDVTVNDASMQPVADAWVTARNGDVIFTSGYTDENGAITLHFDGSVPGDVALTVTRPNYKPILGEFTIQTSGDLAYESMTLNETSGNGNNQPNPGETFEMDVELHNYETSAASGVSGTLASESEYITITDATMSFESLPAGGVGSTTEPFVFEISPETPDRYSARFDLLLTDGVDNWEVSFWLTVQGADLDIVGWTVNDGGNGVLDPGETALVSFSVMNNGEIDISDVEAELIDSSGMIDMIDSLATVGDVTVNSSVSTGHFEVVALSQLVPGMKVSLTLRLTNEDGYLEEETYELPIGVTTVTDPFGPDAYGYICYDDGDTGYADVPVYEWVEIAPSQGGSGTDTGIDDSGDEDDESAIVDLPFSFGFYGRQYTEITINSNGWLAFGETENLSFRHWPVPGAMGPRAQVAAFWTDLYTSDIYTYHDTGLGAFIIEWMNCSLASGGSPVTFQVMLYDPAMYPSANGDGMIKIQYKDVDSMNFFCVGLESPSGADGLQYVYNTDYTLGAKPLMDESTILFLGKPVTYESDYLVLGGTFIHDTNGNGCIDAGEDIELGFSLSNVGQLAATDIEVEVTSSDPYVTITNGVTEFTDIEGGYGGVSLDFITFSVSDNVPDGYSLPFMLNITSANSEWTYPLMLPVYKPQMEVRGYLLNDATGNNDGIADPGETISLGINVYNSGVSDVEDVAAELNSLSGYVTVVDGDQTYGDIPAGGSLQKIYVIELNEITPVGSSLPLSIDVTSSNAPEIIWDFSVAVSTPPGVLDEDFNSWLPDGWSIDGNETNWSQSPSNNAGGQDPEARLNWSPQFTGTSYLVSQPMNLMGATDVGIEFKHSVNNFNGQGYSLGLAIRANNSDWESIWQIPGADIIQETLNFPITSELLNLPNFQFGWYLTGDSYGMNYWYIDDIILTATLGNSATISGQLSIVGGYLTPEDAVVTIGEVHVRPDETGEYQLLAPPGSYDRLYGTAPFYTVDEIENVNLGFGAALEDQDFEIHWLTPADALELTVNEEQLNAELIWEYEEPAALRKQDQTSRVRPGERQTFECFQIWRQLDTGDFVMIDNTDQQEWFEPIDTLHTYTYYVTVKYAEGVSDSTNHQTTRDHTNDITEGSVVEYGDWLGANYPNPFNPTTSISFSLSAPGDVELKVYNVRGQLVRTLADQRFDAGEHTIRWTGDDNSGRQVASGVYFYRITTPRLTEVRKAVLLK